MAIEPAVHELLERERELELVAAQFDATAHGRGGVLVLEGSPGLGKTTLIDRATAIARERGLTVLRARGHELERAFGWGVARSLLELPLTRHAQRDDLLAGPAAPARAILDPSAEAPGTEPGFAILHALYWLVARMAESGPLLVAVDDAQWSDEPSLRFLIYLAGRLPEHPIAILVGARTGDDELLARLAADPAAQVRTLSSLGAPAVAALVRERLAEADDELCERCFALTGGNPLQVRVLLAAIERQPRPAGTAAMAAAAEQAARSMRHRLLTLSPGARALARAVAVFEDDAPLHLAAALTGLPLEAALRSADELAHADVLRDGDPLGFTHPLVRAAVYGEMSFGDRARTHRQAARLLIEAGASGERVSAHLLESGPDGDAAVVGLLRATAQRALAQGVPASAVRYLERALREPPADADRPAVLAELGRAEAAAGLPDAVAHLKAAIGLAGDARQRAALRLVLGRVLQDGGSLGDACAAFQQGRDELGETRSELAVELEAGYLTAAMQVPERASEAHLEADYIVMAPRPTNRAERELASKAMNMRLWAAAPRDELLAIARRLFGDGELAREDGAESRAYVHVVGCLSLCDDYAAAETAIDLMFADAQRRGSASMFAAASQLRARQRLWTGPIPDAVVDARAAFDMRRGASQMYQHASAFCLVSALLEQDEPEAAEDVLRAGYGQPAAVGFYAAWQQHSKGRLAAYRDEHQQALTAFLTTGRRLNELLAINPTVLPWRSEAGLAAHRLGRPDEARELVAEELALAERFGAPRPIGVALRAAGLVERGDAAVERLDAAAGLLAGCGARVEQARALVDLGAAIRRAGRPVDARGTLREALGIAETTGAGALARRAREELRLAGGRAPAPAEGGSGLTPSEDRVAQLAAAGHSNREIADALFVTVKNVEWHLGNVYRKLDIRGRGELAAALQPQG